MSTQSSATSKGLLRFFSSRETMPRIASLRCMTDSYSVVPRHPNVAAQDHIGEGLSGRLLSHDIQAPLAEAGVVSPSMTNA